MNESQWQNLLLDYLGREKPKSVFVPALELKYEIGKYYKGSNLGMPDTVLDIVEFDEKENFHLWELKLLSSKELWTGKFFGQMMLYNFLFSTEYWNELFGRFISRSEKRNNGIKGDVERILSHLANYGEGEVATDDDPKAKFSTWNLCVCGGKGYELAAGYNPVIWSFWVIADEYFKKEAVGDFTIWHFFKIPNGHYLMPMHEISINRPNSLHPEALRQYEKNGS